MYKLVDGHFALRSYAGVMQVGVEQNCSERQQQNGVGAGHKLLQQVRVGQTVMRGKHLPTITTTPFSVSQLCN